ncbi:unnamed protein product [Cochlearia groenlandica]
MSSSSSSEKDKITLQSSDEEIFSISEASARKFQIIANMIDDGCADKTIPLHNVTASILSKVIEFSNKHTEIESDDSVVEESDKKTKIDNWDKEFMEGFEDLDTVLGLLLAANYLNFKELLEVTCQTVADRIKEKSVEEIREIFNIVNDYSPEEEKVVRDENSWAFH